MSDSPVSSPSILSEPLEILRPMQNANDCTTKFDAITRRILAAVQRDGRINNQEISDKAGLSPSATYRRMRRLEAEGIITGYVGLVDPQKIGMDVTAFVTVSLERCDDDAMNAFENMVVTFPEVMECYLMNDADYQLRVVVDCVATFEGFLRGKLLSIPQVNRLSTRFSLRPVKYKTAFAVHSAPGRPALSV